MQSVSTHEGRGANAGRARTAGPARLELPRLEDSVRAMALGDQAALSRVYEQTVGQVFAIASRVLRCREDAEEVVCDVYTHAWQRAGTYDSGRGTVMAWLAVMTKNRAVDRLRQRGAALSLDDDRQSALGASLAGG